MPSLSAGLLVYRISDAGVVEALIAHPGGPLWAKKDEGAWSVPKGEYEAGTDPLAAAEREFAEEIGRPAPDGPRIELGEIKQAGGKRVTVWAVEGDVDVAGARSNTFEMEWPPGSGRAREFPEVDRVEWVTASTARVKLLKGQVPFVDRLLEAVGQRGGAPDQT
ncbi:MAG: NUDIX domain-containing protein [Acidimicrobiales bacterium]